LRFGVKCLGFRANQSRCHVVRDVYIHLTRGCHVTLDARVGDYAFRVIGIRV